MSDKEGGHMSSRAWAYVLGVILAGVGLGIMLLWTAGPSAIPWLPFLALAALATAAQLFKARAPGHQSYHPTLVFLFASLLLLRPGPFVLVVALCHAIEWAKERLVGSPRLRAWYLQPFNIAVHIIAGAAAYGMYLALDTVPSRLLTPASLLAMSTAALVYVFVNHFLIGLALVLARGVSWHESGVLDLENVVTDLILLCLGYIVAALWSLTPWLTLPALSPLVLMYRALMVPQLKKEAQTDEKTSLLNARRFMELSARELERASRFGRLLALIMADLDLLRNINNTYGHLAGDQVLSGIGRIIRETIRDYDIAGRFGGEEFSIVLPEADLEEARAFAEGLRQAIEATEFEVRTSPTPIHVTMSLGVACFPQDATALDDLIHEADVAVYQAKLQGRNRVVCAAEIPHSLRLEDEGPGPVHLLANRDTAEAHHAPYRAAFAFVPHPTSPAHGGYEGSPAAPPAEEEAAAGALVDDGGAVQGPREEASRQARAHRGVFIGGVIAAGVAMAAAGFQMAPPPDFMALGLLATAAAAAQLLQLKNIYGESSVSVSVAINLAAALIAGLPGVALVSGVIVLIHYLQRRPALYKTAFNYATHVLAGSAPVAAINALGIPLRAMHLLLVIVPAMFGTLAYYLVETSLIAAAIALSEGLSVLETWRQRYRWLAEHYLVLGLIGLYMAVAYIELGPLGVLMCLLPLAMIHYAQKQYVKRTQRTVRELKRMNEELAQANREILRASQAIQQLNDELFLTIGKIADARDPYLAGHAAQVAEYAAIIAEELALPSEQMEHLRRAALLHDIGKIGIPERILHKPGRLTAEEYEAFKAHTTLGAELLETCRGLRHLTPLVRHHHERWDGEGYPDGLRGEQIPLEARILAVCDAVDAMASDRPYHQAMPLEDILAELASCSGKQFDPMVVEAFIRLARRNGHGLIINSARRVRRQTSNALHTVSLHALEASE